MIKIASSKNYKIFKIAEVNKEALNSLVSTFLGEVEGCLSQASHGEGPGDMHPASVPSYMQCVDISQKSFCKKYVSIYLDANEGHFITNALGITEDERLDVFLYLHNRFKRFLSEKGLPRKIREYLVKTLVGDLTTAMHEEKARRVREDYKPSL